MLPRLAKNAWDKKAAAHLLNRAGFGGTPAEIEKLAALGHEKAVTSFFAAPDDAAAFAKPDWAVPSNRLERRRENNKLADEKEKRMRQQMERKEDGEQIRDLRERWLKQMLHTSRPLLEKMTLFWHGHFATSMEKVRDPYLIWQQNTMFRTNALGNFGTLTKAVTRDPAMMMYLDTQRNKRGEPNENFARELMELFTLGEGHYTEEDIKNSARAFTGYKIDPRDQTFRFVKLGHDSGEKTFFGATGNFEGDDIVDLIVKKPECGQWIVRKLWTFYAYEQPAPELVEKLGAAFTKANYEIKPLMEEIFLSAEFYSPRAVHKQIKSPVQWLIETAKVLETDLPFGVLAQNALRQLGQNLFAPPNVKGWDGGRAWISTSTLLYRYNLANALVTGDLSALAGKDSDPGPMRRKRLGKMGLVDVDRLAPPELRGDSGALVDSLSTRLFQGTLGEKERQSFLSYAEGRKPDTSDEVVRGLLHLMMSTPEYQLC